MPHSTAVSNPDASNNLIIVMGVSGSGKSSLAKALADHRNRRLAGAKALESRGARNPGDALGNFTVDFGGGNRHFEAAL